MVFLGKLVKIFKKRHSITIMNDKWEVLKNNHKLSNLPRNGEFIYLEEYNSYFKVVNVIHYLNNKHGIFIIVREFSQQKFF